MITGIPASGVGGSEESTTRKTSGCKAWPTSSDCASPTIFFNAIALEATGLTVRRTQPRLAEQARSTIAADKLLIVRFTDAFPAAFVIVDAEDRVATPSTKE